MGGGWKKYARPQVNERVSPYCSCIPNTPIASIFTDTAENNINVQQLHEWLKSWSIFDFPGLFPQDGRPICFPWLQGKRAPQDGSPNIVPWTICGRSFLQGWREGLGYWGSLGVRETGPGRLAAPMLARALVFLELTCWRSEWSQKQNATLHAHWSLGSRERREIARALAVPNPLLDLKLSWTELPISLVGTGLCGGGCRQGRGREGSRLCSILITSSEAAPFPQS